MFELTGTRALITGAGAPNGIGFAIALGLAQHGAQVHLLGRSPRVFDRVQTLQERGYAASGGFGDLADPPEATAVAAGAIAALGGLDILVNNAGMTAATEPPEGESGAADDVDVTGWRASLARNLDSAYWVTRTCLPALRDGGRGRVIMVTSVTGPVMAMRADVGYATAKAGMVGLTRALAVDEARSAITVNAIAPGWIATGSQTEHEAAQGLMTPLGRSGTSREVASAAVWLASMEAGYVTGQVIVVDGGNSIAEERG
jgi:3-oxoacyl-[acyl-carrier protein] reductase